ncbi:MAG: Rieske (2Fe-2S) protein [Thermoplasmata archaeon]
MVRIPDVNPPLEGKGIRVDAEGVAVAVFRIAGSLYAIEATCPHMRGPLEGGRVNAMTVECPWHGSIFSVESGKVLRGPATVPVHAYRARAEGTTLVLDRA